MNSAAENSSESFFDKLQEFFRLFSVCALLWLLLGDPAAALSQIDSSNSPVGAVKPSADFIAADGLPIEKLVALGNLNRADLLAARQRLTSAEGRLRQAGLRPNPTFSGQFGSARFLGGEPERDFSAGVSQIIEFGGKRRWRTQLAELELARLRAEVSFLERRSAAEIRTAYTNALAAARQTDVLEKLIADNAEIVRLTEARLREGDVAPLDVNLVKVENDRLKIQAIQAKSQLETQILELKTLIGADLAAALKLAPQAERPPRLDLNLRELTATALKERADLQAARLAEETGAAQIALAKANAVPNAAASVQFSRSQGVIDSTAIPGGARLIDRDNSLTFGVSLEIPIFNRNQGEIAAASGELALAARQREFLEASIKRDVAVAFRQYRAAAETFVVYAAQILPRAEENLRAVRAAYGFGEFSAFDVVGEQRRLNENVTNYNQSLRDYYAALAALETAIGALIPAAGFAPDLISVLPNQNFAPEKTDREKLPKSFEMTGAKEKQALLKQP